MRHWSPDFESQEGQPTGDSPETSRAWQAQEIALDDTATQRQRSKASEATPHSLSDPMDKRILVLDADPPAQEEFPEFFHD